MDNLEKMVETTILYDTYKSLLTDKQRLYFEDYYFNNLSLSEEAEKYNVSRNAVYSQLSDINNELVLFEAKLGLRKKAEKREKLLTSLKKEATPEALAIINKIEEME